ncbi:recombination mediator RecR [Leptolyngbya sp. 7M]|nr:recombination mediator RecR [Leptolyngbya sp. 7M]
MEQLQRLPGVGPKTAQRLALHILKRPEADVQALAQALLEAKQQVGLCSVCFHLSAEPVCEICRDPNREQQTICVVSDSRDVIALERTREYKGKYHVLGGLISPMEGIGPDQLYITQLVRRVSKQDIKEVILAINPSVEGETTTLYIGQLLKPFTKVTRIAFGLPMGGDLEYADEVTLARALEGRRELDYCRREPLPPGLASSSNRSSGEASKVSGLTRSRPMRTIPAASRVP